MSDVRTAARVDDLLGEAAAAHRNGHHGPEHALASALDAGDAIAAAKPLVDRGHWAAALRRAGIAPSTAFLFMRLAAHRSLIEGAECTSIRQARRLVAAHRAGERARRPRSYEEGYRAGYAEGTRDGFSNGYAAGAAATTPRTSRRRGDRDLGGPPSKDDLKWALRRIHPDVVETVDAERAHRVAAWLNAMSSRRTTA